MSQTEFSPALNTSIDDDDVVLWGFEAFGREINRTTREVYNLYANRKRNGIPIDRVGHRTYKSTRRRLRNWCAGNIPSA